MLLASAQRRRQVIGASRFRFKDYEETPNEVAWFIPAFWRKTRKEGTERAHLVPVMGWGAEAVRKLDRLCDFDGSVGYLFPALKGDGKGHQEINGFNKILDSLPGSTGPLTVLDMLSPITATGFGFLRRLRNPRLF